MTRVKQGTLVFSLLILIGCLSKTGLHSQWVVDSESIKIEQEFQHIQESEPGLLEDKLRRKFPSEIKIGDKLQIKKNGKLNINNERNFRYSLSDSVIKILSTDVVFPLVFDLQNDELFLRRTMDQGTVEWKLSRVK